jgi:hypothetical protein
MISTEIYVEDYKLDLLQDISTEFNYAIDDVSDFGSKNTSYSKTINISGTAKNNQIFGFVFDLGNANFTDNTQPNVNYNFNASKSAQCRIFIDKIQIFKGTLRILEIVVDGKTIEYQCSVFGELGGFITKLANAKLEDLDFSEYNHSYSVTNITGSWDSIVGSGYYYPLIDYGNVSTNKIDFKQSTFRPALYVKEYIKKIFAGTDYTYDLNLSAGDTSLFNRLIVPHNQKILSKSTSLLLLLNKDTTQVIGDGLLYAEISFTSYTGGLFTPDGSMKNFTYTGSPVTLNVFVDIDGNCNTTTEFGICLRKNTGIIDGTLINYSTGTYTFNYSESYFISLVSGDILSVTVNTDGFQPSDTVTITNVALSAESNTPTSSPIVNLDTVLLNDAIPKGIFQKDFFLSVCKMFNLYVYDNIYDDKKIIIKPYIDFYAGVSDNAIDWSNKVDRSKPLSIKPMSELNARYYNYKFKEDNDYYNESYKKKYNESYGDRLFDTYYDFSKDTEVLDVIFSPSPLYQANGTDKIYPAIYKLSDNNTKEQGMDFNIRILQAKKITGKNTWYIDKQDGTGHLSSALTSYGYAGNLDDPHSPTNDINFGVPKELYFSATSYPTTNLFNAYYSDYMAEITSKDSKLLTCYALLNTVDIMNLDFSKYVWIDGILFRLNKVDNFNPMEYNTTKISLLKVIETTY